MIVKLFDKLVYFDLQKAAQLGMFASGDIMSLPLLPSKKNPRVRRHQNPNAKQSAMDLFAQIPKKKEAEKKVEKPQAKEPWEMRHEEWVKYEITPILEKLTDKGAKKYWQGQIDSPYGGYSKQMHESEVRIALEEGKPVPPEVLKDYPELQEKDEPAKQNQPETDPKKVAKLIEEVKPETRTEVTKSLFGFDEKEADVERKKKEEYKFKPKEGSSLDYNGLIPTLDYTDLVPKNIDLVNQKDILTKERPSWIPEVDESYFKYCFNSLPFYRLEANKYVMLTQKHGKDYSRSGITEKQGKAVILSLDGMAATWDYYLKRAKERNKQEADRRNEEAAKRGWTSKQKAKAVRTTKESSMSWEQFHFIENWTGKDKKDVWAQHRLQLAEVKQKMDDMEIQIEENESTYVKGRETSYGRKGTKDNLLKSHGVKVKRQNGDAITPAEVNEIKTAMDDVYSVFGDRSEMAKKYDLLISHSGNVLMHARRAYGIFFPFYHAIGVTMKEGEKGFGFTLAHEFAHFMDNYLATVKGKHSYASDDTSSIANEIARTFRSNMKSYQKSKYQNRTCECFARALEQFYTIKTGEHENYQKERNTEGNHPIHKTYIEKVYPLVEKFFKENDKFLKSIITDDNYNTFGNFKRLE